MKLNEFQRIVAETSQPLIVDFWAAWCGPCKITQPILEGLAEEHKGQVRFLALNVDASPDIVQEYRVMGIPSVIAFREGQHFTRMTGAQNKADYEALFHALAQGEAFQPGVSAGDRLVRLTAALLLVVLGIGFGQWLLLVLGGLIGFWGLYDRCPVWAAITRRMRKKS